MSEGILKTLATQPVGVWQWIEEISGRTVFTHITRGICQPGPDVSRPMYSETILPLGVPGGMEFPRSCAALVPVQVAMNFARYSGIAAGQYSGNHTSFGLTLRWLLQREKTAFRCTTLHLGIDILNSRSRNRFSSTLGFKWDKKAHFLHYICMAPSFRNELAIINNVRVAYQAIIHRMSDGCRDQLY